MEHENAELSRQILLLTQEIDALDKMIAEIRDPGCMYSLLSLIALISAFFIVGLPFYLVFEFLIEPQVQKKRQKKIDPLQKQLELKDAELFQLRKQSVGEIANGTNIPLE